MFLEHQISISKGSCDNEDWSDDADCTLRTNVSNFSQNVLSLSWFSTCIKI